VKGGSFGSLRAEIALLEAQAKIMEYQRRLAIAEERERMRVERRRLRYPRSERDLETGRHRGRCRGCGSIGVIKAHGYCPACYMAFYRKRSVDRELGGVPVKSAPCSKVT
jgi:hypothetical protein